jgi:hypothetical protein
MMVYEACFFNCYNRVDIMNILELRKLVIATLLTFAAIIMLPACSSTEEAPPPEESGDTSSCDCPEGDLQCQEACLQDLPI